MLKIFSQEDFALKSKLRPAKFLEHLPIFAGNSRFTGISQLRAGKTRSKRPRSHCLSTGHLLPYMWASFHPFDPSRYLSSFSIWMKLCAIIILQCKTLTCFLYQGMWQLQWQDCNVGITKIIVYNLGDGIIGLTKLYCSEMVSCKSIGSRPLPAASATVWGAHTSCWGQLFKLFKLFKPCKLFFKLLDRTCCSLSPSSSILPPSSIIQRLLFKTVNSSQTNSNGKSLVMIICHVSNS